MGQISYAHLWYEHGITFDEYKERFPGAALRVVSERTRQQASESLLGRPGTFQGRMHSEATKEQIRESLTGGTYSEVSKQRISKSHEGNMCALGHIVSEKSRRAISEGVSYSMKRTWKDPEYVQHWSEGMSRAMSRVSRGPNDSELQLQSILDKHFPSEWKYVGNGQARFGNRNPDFINVNGRKQVIEMFGLYWHDPDLFPNRPTEGELVAHYKKFGIDCVVIWEYDIFDEDEIVRKVKELRP